MFSIETTEDVRILKELAGFSNDNRIKELELEVQELSRANNELLAITQEQKELIGNITKSLVTADKCRDIVSDMLKNTSKSNDVNRKKVRTIGIPKPDEDEFTFAKVMRKEFNKIIVDGNQLIHHTIKNQRMPLPISTVELLAFVEVYQYRQRKLLNKDSRNICKLFRINKVQFGKLYYNLKEGVFFDTINEIDNQIKRTNFKLQNGTIHIVDGSNLINTKIDSRMFHYLVNVYVNSKQPYSAIYKLSKEKHQINPIHILTVLKRNDTVSKAFAQG